MDSVTRLLSILGQQQIPAAAAGIPNDRLVDNGMLFGSIDFAPPSSTTGQALQLAFNGGWNRQDPLFGGVTDVPARSGDRTSWNGTLMGRHTNFIGYFLSETSLGVSTSYLMPSVSQFFRVSFMYGSQSLRKIRSPVV